nr:NADH-ubiquinone oxidoreductase chain 2 [Savius diagonalis]
MILNSNKLLFMIMLVLSTMITLNAQNWMGMWMGLEMNLMSFIPLISSKKNKNSSQSMTIYFLAQSMGSINLLFSILINHMLFLNPNMINELIKMLITTSILIKLGAAPFHFWFPEMLANLNWSECMIMMTWQKIAPLFVMYMLMINNWYFYLSIILCSIIGAIGGLNQTSLRKILAYSSINHMSWMMMFMSLSGAWYKYLLIYSIMIILTCQFFNLKKSFFINQLCSMSSSMTEKFTYTILMMSLGGLPPFLGFLPKWMVIQIMINSEMYFMLLFLMMMTLLTLFYYMRMMTTYFLNYTTINKWMLFNNNNKIMLLINFINLMLPLFLINSFF